MIVQFKFKKKYGQNFIKDNNIIKKIVDLVVINKDDLIIEVGPGAGSLTKYLVNTGANVVCYEIDNDLKDYLTKNINNNNNIQFIFDDFLKRDLYSDIKKYNYKNLYFISNVPYYITTPILFKLIDVNLDFKNIIMMVQKEVGERFSARVGTKAYSAITVLINYFYNVNIEFDVEREYFYPMPNVDSVVISLSSKEVSSKVCDYKFFEKVVFDSFQFKRKNIKNNLFNYNLDIVKKVLNKYNYDLDVRAEKLDVNIFVDLCNNLYNK